MREVYEQTQEAAAYIRERWAETPQAGVILGTGLGAIADEIDDPIIIDYAQIPHFPRSTAISHAGRLVCGRMAGVPVGAMEGRFHYYEGYSLKQVTLPVRVMKALGADLLIVSQAAGGMNPYFRIGDVMLIDD
ncbi:MAG: purine-nucleoside phosphorylase, partial [Planctomycetales bacterium]|nr:purine-nucleoside phosphorylase [Planctomycetales bacterium]